MNKTNRTIVVIDDDPNQAALLNEYLSARGYAVRTAGTGKEGIQKIQEFHPDMIILDLFLPDIMGSDVCAHLRANTITRHIPIILCTAHKIDPAEKIKGFRAGADDYLVRPFELTELEARIEAVWRRSDARPREDQPPAVFPTKPPASSTRPGPASTHRPIPNIFERVWKLLNDPVAVFRRIDESEDFFVGICLVIGTPIIASAANLIQANGFDNWIGVLSLGLMVQLLLWFGTAGLLHMTMPFQGVTLSMRRALTIAGLCWAPRLLEAVLGMIYALVAGVTLAGEKVIFSSGINLLPGLPANGLVSAVSRIGLFDFWSAALTLMAVWTLSHTQQKRWSSITAIIGISCLLFGALSSF